MTLQEIVSDQQIEKAFENTRYGENPNHREIIKDGILKVASGYANGFTTMTILTELGLATRRKTARQTQSLTKLGKQYLYGAFCK